MDENLAGTITFLFTDIEGSTRLWEGHPEAMKGALARHDQILRTVIEANGGHIFKTMGDAFCAAFGVAPDALQAALDAQRGLQAEAWEGGIEAIRVRMALHTGTVQAREGDYFGPPLNRVARLLAAAHGGQVLLSLAAQELVRDCLPPSVSLRDMGSHRLKDLFRTEHIYQLIAPGLPQEFPPLRSLDIHQTNLPVQPTPFIGRERELSEVVHLIQGEDVRLVTLTGPGGTGKTRLLLQAAADLLEAYPDGVFFVDLSPLHDSGLVMQTIAATLGLRPRQAASAADELASYLAEKRLLLALDNFEQVVEAAKEISRLLGSIPSLKVLASSRRVLNIYGEHEYPVPPLSLPERRRGQTAASLSQYESVALFIQRAKATRADFKITEENAPEIAEICLRLEGLPLAIELAAAHSKMLKPAAMLQRLEDQLRALRSSLQDIPARQRTMRAAIDWSYELLEEAEKTLLARLGVFRHGWFLDAAQAVCAGEDQDVFDGLEALLDKSLIREMASGTGETRFVMLEVIREYAAEKLGESGEAAAICDLHAAYYLHLAEQLSAWDQKHYGDIFTEELDNLRAAIDWALKTSRPALAEQIIYSLWGGLLTSGFAQETLNWIERILAQKEGLETKALARAWRVAGVCNYHLHRFEAAQRYYEQALQLCRETGDKSGEAANLNNLAVNASEVWGDYEKALALYEQARALHHEVGNKIGMGIALGNLAEISADLGRDKAALAYCQQAVQLFAEISSYPNLAWVKSSLGGLLGQRGDHEGARRYLMESAAIFQEFGMVFSGWLGWFLKMALLAAAEGKAERAAQLQGVVDAIQEESLLLAGQELKSHKELKEQLKALLGEADYQAAWGRGRNFSEEQAISFGKNLD
ncbi:MAG: tetratricopeptide repeat protein [Anaerolineales bacterium]|nr:tetratricopeptide repeat protein [Anaerolineales bacterium]